MTIRPATAGSFVLVPLAVCLLSGCQQRMAAQPSYKPLDPSTFFPDGRSARPQVPGTVARGHLRTDLHYFTGRRAAPREEVGPPAPGTADYANAVDTFPFAITQEILKQGQDRYMIYCVVCHDPLGTGEGKIVERGYTRPPSYHIDRLRAAPVGHFYEVITNGYGSMPDYKQQIPPRDRWAIAAYLRALQWSQHVAVNDLPANLRAEWDQQQAAAGGPPR